jgi:hypothetical protein
LNGKRDSQRGAVYRWEDALVGPRDTVRLPFSCAQGMINAIWAETGLLYPPLAELLPANTRRRLGCATRLAIGLPAQFYAWVLLHELAHSMTASHAGESDGHGPDFVGVYVVLLVRYLRFDQDAILASISAADIRCNANAKPIFVDA